MEKIKCLLVDSEIEIIDCIENSDVADRVIKEESLPKAFKRKENWREICKKCEYHKL